MSDRYTSERVIKVWDDKRGDHIYIGPDGDGLDLVELRSVQPDGFIETSISFPVPMALLVAKAILELYAKEPSP